MMGSILLTCFALFPMAIRSSAYQDNHITEPVSLYQNLYRFRTLGLESYAHFSQDLTVQQEKKEFEREGTFKLYARILSEDFDRVLVEKVHTFFKGMDNWRVDIFFGYLANHMFIDANVETAISFFGRSMTRDHQAKLERILPIIQRNYKLTFYLSPSSLVKVVQKTASASNYAKYIDNGKNSRLRKAIALFAKTEDLAAFIGEEQLYFIGQILKANFVPDGVLSAKDLQYLKTKPPFILEEIVFCGF